MSLLKMPCEIDSKDMRLRCLIYGQPGLGKSTLALSMPNPVLIDCDGGIRRIAPAHRVPSLFVEDYQSVLNLLNSKELTSFETIVIDTVGKLLDYMSVDIIKHNSKMGKRDGSLSLQGYGARRMMFLSLLKTVTTMGKHIIFVAHEKEERNGDDKIVRPDISGSSCGDLIKDLDLVGYMEAIGRQRTISFTPCEKYYAKNSARLDDIIKIPTLSDGTPNDLLTTVVSKCQSALEQESELDKRYREILEEVKTVTTGVKDSTSANEALHVFAGLEDLWGAKKLAWNGLLNHCNKLGVTFDKKEKVFKDAEAKAEAKPDVS